MLAFARAEMPAPHWRAYNFGKFFKERVMTQKVIDVVGTSKDSFAKAAENAVAEAAKTVRGIKWAHVDSLDMQLDGAKVLLYRATTKIYFDVEH
jgi:dodecin